MVLDFTVNGIQYYFDGNSMELFEGSIPPNHFKLSKPRKHEENILSTATLFLTARCNANCKYCYEQHSNNSMNIESAKKVIEYLCAHYKKIEKISFFGGEPFLCFDIIKYVVVELNKKSIVEHYEVTTNAVLLTDEIIDFLVTNNFHVIISMDGPKSFHDFLRTGCDYDLVKKNIMKLKNSPIKSNIIINCTYTKYHQDNIDYHKLINFFENLGCDYEINDVITELSDLQLHKTTPQEKIDACLNDLTRGSCKKKNRYVSGIINALVKNEYLDSYCPELVNGIAFGTDGNVFPCVKLINKCSITNPLLIECNSKKYYQCQNCWARGLCSGCTAQFYENEVAKPIETCDYKENYKYALEKLISYLQKSPESFQRIIDNFYT